MAQHLKNWLLLAVLALGLLIIYQLLPILTPFLVSILLAYMGDPVVDFLERYKVPRTVGVIAVFVLVSLIMLVLLLVLVPMIGRQLVSLYGLTPQLIDWLQDSALPWLQLQLGISAKIDSLDSIKQMFSENLGKTTDVMQMLLAKITASSVVFLGWLANMLLIPVVTFYLLRDWDILVAKLRRLLPRKNEKLVVNLIAECHEVLGAFMRGQLLVMLALGVVYAAGLMVLGLELGLLIGLLAGLASLVPYMGFIVGIGAALIAGLFQFGLDPYLLLGIVAVFAIGQALESMLLTPLLVGDRIGLHPVAVIFAILAGGQLFGFTGVLLALPVAAVIMVLLRHLYTLYTDSNMYGQSNAAEQPINPVEAKQTSVCEQPINEST
ncbi:AI-2E family transporter [Denitrificimonas caeni]|uniref:AI-2E family transporter n=1 Tax=Denitrificimonas caeni TaxID=521720 RepID=A0AAE9VL05_9GAMM|nr:AI-2E family transporter [Denitrificimonas caeni]NLJ12659.1 AI-2E family transporter [Gammaproteobacteria bacterium]WBE24126.1 AI-2E family transporter [Denitrificimonas caeni]